MVTRTRQLRRYNDTPVNCVFVINAKTRDEALKWARDHFRSVGVSVQRLVIELAPNPQDHWRVTAT